MLDEAVKNDTDKYVPSRSNSLSNSPNNIPSGSGYVEYDTPYARYLYYGKLMVSPTTGSPWASLGETKVLTERNLTYDRTAHPLAGAHWFDRSLKENREEWVKVAKRGFIYGK